MAQSREDGSTAPARLVAMSDNAGMAPKSTAEWQAINEKFIREFRENGGRVGSATR